MFHHIVSLLRHFWTLQSPTPKQNPAVLAFNARTSKPKFTHVCTPEQLRQAIYQANEYDCIVIARSGNYGEITIHNKAFLTLKAAHTGIISQAYIVISGTSKQIRLEQLSLWHRTGNPNQGALLSTGEQTQHVLIQNCHIASIPNSTNNLLKPSAISKASEWVNGLHLQGKSHQVTHSHFSHLANAIRVQAESSLIYHNTIQFFCRNALSLAGHGNSISKNNINTPIKLNQGDESSSSHGILIQAAQPTHSKQAGRVFNLNIIGNTIKQQHYSNELNQDAIANMQGITSQDCRLESCYIQNNHILLTDKTQALRILNAEKSDISDNHIQTQPCH